MIKADGLNFGKGLLHARYRQEFDRLLSLVHPTCLLLRPGAGLGTWRKKSATSLVGRDWPALRSTLTPTNRSSRISLQPFRQGSELQLRHFASAMYFTNQTTGQWVCCSHAIRDFFPYNLHIKPATAHGVGEIDAKEWTPRMIVISDISFIYCTRTLLHPQNTAASLARPNVYILPTIKKSKVKLTFGQRLEHTRS